jgi:Spy/CpxP family protein refolding chaperone
MTRWFPVSLASGLALLLVASSASAQDPAAPPAQTPTTQAPQGTGQPQRPLRGRPGGPGAMPNPNGMTAPQVEQMFDAYMVVQSQASLQLPDEQFFTFSPRLQRLQLVRRRTQRARTMMLRELAMLVNATPVNDQAIAAKLKEVDDLGDRSQQEIRQAYTEIDSVLTPRQRALFRVFEERMERQKLDLMIRARQQVRQPVPPAGPPAAAQGRRSGGGR